MSQAVECNLIGASIGWIRHNIFFNKVVESLLRKIQSKQVMARAINNFRGIYPDKGKNLPEMHS